MEVIDAPSSIPCPSYKGWRGALQEGTHIPNHSTPAPGPLSYYIKDKPGTTMCLYYCAHM